MFLFIFGEGGRNRKKVHLATIVSKNVGRKKVVTALAELMVYCRWFIGSLQVADRLMVESETMLEEYPSLTM